MGLSLGGYFHWMGVDFAYVSDNCQTYKWLHFHKHHTSGNVFPGDSSMGAQVTELCLSGDELECSGQKCGWGKDLPLALSALMVRYIILGSLRSPKWHEFTVLYLLHTRHSCRHHHEGHLIPFCSQELKGGIPSVSVWPDALSEGLCRLTQVTGPANSW